MTRIMRTFPIDKEDEHFVGLDLSLTATGVIVLDKNGIVLQIFSGGMMDESAKTHAYGKMKPVIDKHLSLD